MPYIIRILNLSTSIRCVKYIKPPNITVIKMSDISLEAFESSLRSKKSTWFIQDTQIAFPPGFNDMIITENPAIQRTILLVGKESSDIWKHLEDWYAILTITTNQDWSLAMTYILYQPKPTLVIACPELAIPQQVYQKLNGITFVQFAFYNSPINRSLLTTDCILMQQTSTDSDIDYIYNIIQQLGQPHTKQNIKDILRDTRTASASILVSSIDEPRGKQMYWYYATPITRSSKVDSVIGLIQTVIERHS